MSLAAGDHLGPYTIIGPLGSGGMGEVYRAHDPRLAREVALKLLPSAFTQDADRVARFQREAQVLASLNHPNIGAIHGIEDTAGARALVLELVEGPTLEDRIAAGPIPLDEALGIARQIADALEAAHECGVIHRDLKPSNIKLRPDGTVKVLDFGLAKPSESTVSAPALSMSPTITSPAMTMAGVILGTAAYMSPEQAKGKPVDRRADVWAFGCVLYEMLTGTRPFAGDDVSDTLAFVLTREPNWALLPAATSPGLRVVLQRCLAKDPKQRVRSVGDVRLALDGAFEPNAVTRGEQSSKRRVRRTALSVMSILAAGAVGGVSVWYATGRPQSLQIQRLSITTPADAPLSTINSVGLAISPNGKHIVYVATRDRVPLLYLRSLDMNVAVPLRGTEGATRPFFSPDSEWIAFFAGGKLKKIAANNGVATDICTTGVMVYSGSWGRDSTIVFSSTPLRAELGSLVQDARLFRVDATGGSPEPVIPDGSSDQTPSGQTLPQILPGGRHILFTKAGDPPEAAVLALDTGVVHTIRPGIGARYVKSGHLVFTSESSLTTLMVVPFDLRRLRTSGSAVALGETAPPSPAWLAVSDNGVLVYGNPVDALVAPRSLVWVDRNGQPAGAIKEPGIYRYPTLSPNGGQVSVGIGDDIWVIDLQRQSRTRLTLNDRVPPATTRVGVGAPVPMSAWTPNGRHITFASLTGTNDYAIEQINSDGSGGRRPLLKLKNFAQPGSWTPDGKTLVFYQTRTVVNGRDIWMVQPGNDPIPLLETKFQERAPRLSPDGRWLAYVSDASGRDEVYLRPLISGAGGQITVSNEGGGEPVWSRAGKELYYRNGSKLMAVAVSVSPALSVGQPKVLFDEPFVNSERGGQIPNYDVSPDGSRFLMVAGESLTQAVQIPNLNVVLNWFEELKQRAPAR